VDVTQHHLNSPTTGVRSARLGVPNTDARIDQSSA
jgi:hypothetical protein